MRVKIMSQVLAMIVLGVFCMPMAQAGHGQGGSPTPPAGTLLPLSCRVVDGEDLGIGATLTDGYGQRQVRIGAGRLLCTYLPVPADGTGTGLAVDPGEPVPADVPDANALRCYNLSTSSPGQKQGGSTPSPDLGILTDGWHVGENAQDVTVGNPQYLCVPAHVVAPSSSQ